jgi:hypothetical protein
MTRFKNKPSICRWTFIIPWDLTLYDCFSNLVSRREKRTFKLSLNINVYRTWNFMLLWGSSEVNKESRCNFVCIWLHFKKFITWERNLFYKSKNCKTVKLPRWDKIANCFSKETAKNPKNPPSHMHVHHIFWHESNCNSKPVINFFLLFFFKITIC